MSNRILMGVLLKTSLASAKSEVVQIKGSKKCIDCLKFGFERKFLHLDGASSISPS